MRQEENSLLPDILNRIERYEQGIQRHKEAAQPSKMAIAQYEEMRDEMIAFLLDYLVEIGGANALRNCFSRMNRPQTA